MKARLNKENATKLRQIVGKKIFAERTSREWPRRLLIEKTGYSISAIVSWEKFQSLPTVPALIALSSAFGNIDLVSYKEEAEQELLAKQKDKGGKEA